MKNNDSSKSSLSFLLTRIRNFLQGIYNFIIGAVNLARLFIVANIESIIMAVFIFATLLLIQISVYLSCLLTAIYFIYEVRLWINSKMELLADLDTKNQQSEKLQALRNIQGFKSNDNAHPAEMCEILSREVFYWFCEKTKHVKSSGFRQHLKDLGYSSPPVNIQAPMESGIQTTIAYNGENSNLLVLTAGTDFEDIKTLVEDLDHSGPGRQAFLKHRDDIIKPILEESKGLDYINVAGHSFGGAISMMIVVELLKEMKAGRLNLKGINLFIYQSAGVNNEVAEEAKTLLACLEDSHSDFSLNMVSHYHDFDPIPGSGIQILSDYLGKNANVFAVRRHASFEAFLNIISTFFGMITLAHQGYVYDQIEYLDKHDHARRELAKDSAFQVYQASGRELDADHQNMQIWFQSTHTKFICNETMYKFFSKYHHTFLKIIIVGTFFSICLSAVFLNLGYLLFIPDLLNLQNFYYSLGPTLGAWAYFKGSYKQYQEAPRSTIELALHKPVMPEKAQVKLSDSCLESLFEKIGLYLF